MTSLKKIKKFIQSAKIKRGQSLEDFLEKNGWINEDVFMLSPCKKFLIKENGLCYSRNGKFKSLYLPTEFFRKKRQDYLIQPYCKGSDSNKTLNKFDNRLKKILYKNVSKKKLFELVMDSFGEEEFISADIHEGNVCIYKGQPVLHDW